MATRRFTAILLASMTLAWLTGLGLRAIGQSSSDVGAEDATPLLLHPPGTSPGTEVPPEAEEGAPFSPPENGASEFGKLRFYPDLDYLRRFSHASPTARMRRPPVAVLKKRFYDPTQALREERERFLRLQREMGRTVSPSAETLSSDRSETVYSPRPSATATPLYAPPTPRGREGF